MKKLNWFEKVRDNFIPIEKLYNKFFYSERVASVLLELPMSEIGQETSLLFLLQKGFSKYELLKLYKKQNKLEIMINKAMSRFRVYDSMSRRYIQTITVQYGQGIEFLMLGEILERKYKFDFKYKPEQIAEDKGYALCADIIQVLNRIEEYYKDHKKEILNSIKEMIKEQRLSREVVDDQ